MDDFEYLLINVDDPDPATNVIFQYGSQDEFFDASFGFIAASNFGFGQLNIYVNTPYAKCDKSKGKSQTAIYTTRGGDNIVGNIGEDGTSTNLMVISRSEYTFEKEKNSQWMLTSIVVKAKIFETISLPLVNWGL